MDDHAPVIVGGTGRAAEEGDWIAGQFFTPEDLTMSPEEYVARNAHNWGCFSLDQHAYRDPILGAWVKRVGELLSAPDEAERCRLQYLTPDELAAVRARQQDPF